MNHNIQILNILGYFWMLKTPENSNKDRYYKKEKKDSGCTSKLYPYQITGQGDLIFH